MTTVEIVRVGPEDAGLVQRAADLFDLPPQRAWIDAFLAAPGHHLLVALDGSVPVGFVSGVEMIHPDKGIELFVYELATADAHRRRGVATALLDALAAVAAERGCYGLWVSTEPDNVAALATYRSAGFIGEESITLDRRLVAADRHPPGG